MSSGDPRRDTCAGAGPVFLCKSTCGFGSGSPVSRLVASFNVWRRFGLPRKQISDRGPQFAAAFTTALCKKLGIQHLLSTAFHPQTDGETERVNQEVEQYLRAFCNHEQDDWARWLPIAEYVHNSRQHSATGKTLFELIMGYTPSSFETVGRHTSVEAVNDRMATMIKVRDEAKASMAIARDLARRRGDRPEVTFTKGMEVWLEGKNITTTHPSAKLAPKRHGPFKIIEKINPVTFRLRIPE